LALLFAPVAKVPFADDEVVVFGIVDAVFIMVATTMLFAFKITVSTGIV
jgi:hypothetical protein